MVMVIYIHGGLAITRIINMNKAIEKFFKEYYPLLFIVLLGLILITGPFILSNNLEGFDAAGQYANAYYIRHYFWPWPGGWNALFLTGFPQGLFYPSFFHWLVAVVSFIMPLKIAYKIILSLAVIFFPLVYFFFTKKIFGKSIFANIALSLAGIFYYFDLGLNDNLFCDLYFGMSPHLFSLSLFFVYLYFLFNISKNKGRWQIASIILAITIVTHAITGIMAIFLGVIFLIITWRQRFVFINTFKHLVLAALLSMWWWLPFLLNISYMSGSDISSEAAPILIILMPFVLMAGLVSLKIKNENTNFIKTISIFNILIIISYLLGRIFFVQSFPVHFSRFLIYPLLLSPISLLSIFYSHKYNWQKINLILVFVFSFYLFFFRIIPVGPFDTFLLDNLNNYYDKGRVIVTGGSRYLDDRFHTTRMKLAMNYNLPLSEGLFVESSANGWFIMSMMQSWENTVPTFVWGYKNLKGVADLKWGADILGVNYEYRLNDKRPSVEENSLIEKKSKLLSEDFDFNQEDDSENRIKELNDLSFKIERTRLIDNERKISILGGNNNSFYYQAFYKVGETSLAETLSVRPVNIEKDWRENTQKWWSSDWLKIDSENGEYRKPILIYRHNPEDWQLSSSSVNFPVSFVSKKMDIFLVDASALKSPAPIYVKEAYFPFWRAFDENGQSLPVYKVSPNFMLVYGRGVITFKYLEPWYYYAGFIVSGISLLLGLFSLFFFKAAKKG